MISIKVINISELRILHEDQIYPEKSGAFLRSFNLAKLASSRFKTNLYGVNEKIEYQNLIENIYFIQEKKYNNVFNKLKHFTEGLLSKNYSLWYPNAAFKEYNEDETIFQIAGPYLYNYLKKKDIGNFILDEQNVYWELSKFPSFNLKNKLYYKLSSKRDKLIEVNAVKNAKHIIVCSERDKNIITKEIIESKEKITVIPNCVNFSKYESYSKCKKFVENEKQKILFMGLLSYAPNRDAVNNICNNIAPYFIDEEVEFVIIGKNPPNNIEIPNVKFLGYVENLKNRIMDSTICIAPLSYGSGTRFKILEYMAMGKPVISTSKGAEGIDYSNNENIIIEDNIDNYAQTISKLLENKKKRNKIGSNAQNLIKSKYDWKIYKKELNDMYNEVLND